MKKRARPRALTATPPDGGSLAPARPEAVAAAEPQPCARAARLGRDNCDQPCRACRAVREHQDLHATAGNPHARYAGEVPLPEPQNAEYICDFTDAMPLTWAEWVDDEDIPIDRPKGNKPGDDYARRCWDAARKDWRESEEAVTATITAAINACAYGCAELGGRFVHDDGTVWLCHHRAPWPQQVTDFREHAAANGY